MRMCMALWLGSLLLVVAPRLQAGETVTYYLTDAQGTVLMTEDANGVTMAAYDYRPYGTSEGVPTPTGPGYTGHVNDPDTGLVYMQQRYYDAEIGRFLSVDPVGPTSGDVFNFGRYTYANNNPVRFTDPDGRCPNCITAGIGAGVGALVGLTVEGYYQYKRGEFNGKALAIETGKGALVGAVVGFTGGLASAPAASMSLSAQVATTSFVAGGVGAGAHSVGEVLKGNPAPSAAESLAVGGATAIGAAVGILVGPLTTSATTTVTPAIRSSPVTSLSGKTFYTVNIPAQSIASPGTAELLNNAAASGAEQAVTPLLKNKREEQDQGEGQ